MLKYRIITAAILAPVIIGIAFIENNLLFALLSAFFFVIAAWEWAKLAGFSLIIFKLLYTLLLISALYLTYFLPALPLLILTFSLWIWVACAIGCYLKMNHSLGFQYQILQALTGLILLSGCWKAMIILHAMGAWVLLLALLLVWSVDIGGYTAGRLWGQSPLALRISPKKTWVGFWGGIILATVVSYLLSLILPINQKQRLELIIIVIISALFSVVGDLFVSLLKRQSGLKDTGRIIPGHGGILDRLDSIMAGVPIFTLGLFWL